MMKVQGPCTDLGVWFSGLLWHNGHACRLNWIVACCEGVSSKCTAMKWSTDHALTAEIHTGKTGDLEANIMVQ